MGNHSYLRHGRATVCVLVGVVLAGVPLAQAVHKTAQWTGAVDQNFGNAANWDINEVPLDNVTDTFSAVIPTGFTVSFDVMGSGHKVTQLSLASGSTLNINPGRDLQVLDAAAISGLINTSASIFMASHPSSTLGGTAARLLVTGGGSLTHAGVSWTHTSLSNGIVIGADGLGSTLTLSQLQTFSTTNDPFGANVRRIEATNQGQINLSALQNLTGPSGDDRLDIVATGGGTINLSSLQTLVGSTRFVTDALTLTLNSVTTAQNLSFSLPVGATVHMNNLASQSSGSYALPAGTTFNLPSLTSMTNATVTMSDASAAFNAPQLTDINHSRFILSGGAALTVAAQPTWTITNLGHTTVASVDAASLDLSTMQTLVATNEPFGANRRTFTASNGGTLNLSGLTTINGPTGDDRVDMVSQTGGTINLSNLTMTTGNVLFQTDASSFSLPALVNAGAISFSLNAGATLSLPVLAIQNGGSYNVPANSLFQLPALTQLNDAAVAIAQGGTFQAPLLTDVSGSTITLGPGQTFTTGSLNVVDNARIFLTGGISLAVTDSSYTNTQLDQGDIFSADGAGTQLNLSTFTSFSSTQNPFGVLRRNIRASAGAIVNLSGVTAIAGPSGDDRLDFITSTGGSILLTNLQTISAGNVNFVTDQTSYSLPQLAHASALTFDLPDNSSLNLPELLTQAGGGYQLPLSSAVHLPKLTQLTDAYITINDAASSFNAPNLTNINNTRITLTHGAALALTINSYDARNIGNAAIFSADGAGTLLDLSTLGSLDANTNPFGVNRRTIQAANLAHIDLSSLQNVQGSTGDDRLDIVASAGGLIDMSSLQSLASGNTRIAALSGGLIKVGHLTVSSTLTLEAANLGSRIVTGDLHLQATATLAVTDGAMVQVAGHFSHELLDETKFNGDTARFQMNGSGTRFFEVAGRDLGLISATSNFGLAQLIIGDTAVTTHLVLTDLVDNGNRSSPEALYLLGSGGLDGLQLLNNSTLDIGNIPVYVLINGTLTELHSLFMPGEYAIPYVQGGSSGFITIPEPASLLLLGSAMLLTLVRRRG